MTLRRLGLALALLAASSCGDGPPDQGTSDSGDSGSSTIGWSSEGVGDDTTEGPPPQGCMITPGDHTAACPAGDCPITTDVELHCNPSELAHSGLHVAPGPDGPVLATISDEHLYYLRALGDEGEVSDIAPTGPFQLYSSAIAQEPSGDVHVMLATSQPRLRLLDPEDASVDEVVCDPCGDIFDFGIAPDGTLHVWYDLGGPRSEWHGVRVGPDDWSAEPAPPTFEGAYAHYVHTPQGQVVAFSLEAPEDQLWRRTDGVDEPFGSPALQDLNVHLFPFMPAELSAPTLPSEGPSHVILMAKESGLVVVWDDPATGWLEQPVPGTDIDTPLCGPGQPAEEGGPGCNVDPCHETSTGFHGKAHNVARTEDGALWITWVEDRNDFIVSHVEDCDPNGCWCRPEYSDDQSTARLHVLRFDFVGPPQERLSLDFEPIARHGASIEYLAWPLDARAFEDRLAIGVRLREDPGELFSDPKVRLLELDLSLLD